MQETLEVGSNGYIIESNRTIINVVVIAKHGEFYVLRMPTGGAIKLRRGRIFLSKEEADQMMLASSDMTVSEYVDTVLQQVDFSELFATFHTQEVYYVQDGQLFAAINWDAAFEGKTFTLTDGKLVIEGITLEEGGEPLIWTKA